MEEEFYVLVTATIVGEEPMDRAETALRCWANDNGVADPRLIGLTLLDEDEETSHSFSHLDPDIRGLQGSGLVFAHHPYHHEKNHEEVAKLAEARGAEGRMGEVSEMCHLESLLRYFRPSEVPQGVSHLPDERAVAGVEAVVAEHVGPAIAEGMHLVKVDLPRIPRS